MKNLIDYIEEYGEMTFKEKPFNEIDNLIFSQLAYTDFGGIIGCDTSETLLDAAKIFYSLHSQQKIDELISISAKSAELLKRCSMTKRFSNVIIAHYINNVNDEIDKQFSAVHFIIDADTDVVAFRGTDVTVTGVKESAMLSFMFPVPAQIEALYYFQETAMMHSGDIILCGHSKGGNLAVFAAVNCSNSLKKKGLRRFMKTTLRDFRSSFLTDTITAKLRIKFIFYTPQGSIIGRMLYHDAKSTIVHSENSGLKQHQVSSWEVDGDSFKTEEKYDRASDFFSDYINELIDYISDEELELFFDTLEYVATHMGIEDFYDTKEFDIKKALFLVDSITTLDEEHKTKFKGIIKKVVSDFTREYFTEKTQPYKEMFENLRHKKKFAADGGETNPTAKSLD